jgi:hypothetical protein
MQICEERWCLLTRMRYSPNRLYSIWLNIVQPVCLTT